MNDKHNESTTGLVAELMTHVTALFRKEIDLARAEIDQNAKRAGAAVGMLVAAMVIALTALNVLSAAIVAGLTELGIDAGWSALIVGVGLGVIALVLVNKGTNDLKLSSLAPTRTAENVKRDAQAIKGVQKDAH